MIELELPAPWPRSADFSRFDLGGFETSGNLLSDDAASKPEVANFLHRCGPATIKLLFGCDKISSSSLLSSDTILISTHASSTSMDGTADQLTRKHGDVHVTLLTRHEPVLRLFSAILDGFPRCLPPDINFVQVANIICRGTFSADPSVCISAGAALRRIAEDPAHCLTLVSTYLHLIFETRHIFRDTFVGLRVLESHFERVIILWLDLVAHQRKAAAHSGGDREQSFIPQTSPASIGKIEGCALLLLCSTSLPLRRLAGRILNAARDLEGQQRRPSAAFRYSRTIPDKALTTRVAQLYAGSWDDSDVSTMRKLAWCTSSDRHRLEVATINDKSKLMTRIAESDHPKDAQLWLSLVPFFVSRVVEQLPGAAEELRSVVSNTVLRLQGHIAAIGSPGASRNAPGMRQSSGLTPSSTDTAILADHWRAYLAILCVTMPPLQPTPATPPVQRTKEAIILTPDTIRTPALLHYLTSLLAWEDPRFKDATVHALGCIGQSLLRPLSEILLGVVRRLADGSKVGGTPRDGTRRILVASPLWTAVSQVFRLISPLILDGKSSSHHASLSSLIGFVKVTFTLLSDRVVKEDYDLQTLRRSYCIVVENLTNALGKLDASDRFLGEEMRGAVFKLCYDWCHIGRRPDVAKARESHTLQAAADSYRGDRDRAQYLDDLQTKTKLLSAAAADAMAGLCVSYARKLVVQR